MQSFVVGGVINPAQQQKHDDDDNDAAAAPLSAKRQRYIPQGFQQHQQRQTAFAFDNADDEDDEEDKGLTTKKRKQPTVSKKQAVPSSGKRKMDLLLNDLKRQHDQQQRLSSNTAERDKNNNVGTITADDVVTQDTAATTNIFVSNLSPHIDETTLLREFGRFGPIGSVKIMWPRGEEQIRRRNNNNNNNGFIAFMCRKDAENARNALDGVMLHGVPLALGWGKAMPLPAVPIWPPPHSFMAVGVAGDSSKVKDDDGREKSRDYFESSTIDGYPPLPFLHQQQPIIAPPGQGPGPVVVPGPGPIVVPDMIDVVPQRALGVIAPLPIKPVAAGHGPDTIVSVPISNPRQRFIIDATASFVAKDGCDFEQIIMEQQYNNSEFDFLYNIDSPEHVYYKWRVYSLTQGDTLQTWRVEPFLMVEGGNRWVPPPMTVFGSKGVVVTAAQRGEGERRKTEGMMPLEESERGSFESILSMLSLERVDICRAMAFALDNADSADEIADLVLDIFLLQKEDDKKNTSSATPFSLKIARFYLLSDILYNSGVQGVKNASKYRSKLEERLPDVMESLQLDLMSSQSAGQMSRIALETCKRYVSKVLRVWKQWLIFSDDYMNGLHASFEQQIAGTDMSMATAAASVDGDGNGGGEVGATTTVMANNNNNKNKNIIKVARRTVVNQLATMTDEQMEAQCKRSGLSRKGGRKAQEARILLYDIYVNGPVSTEERAAEERRRQVEAKLANAKTDGWQVVT
jgi:U2-associated protein SR140